MFDLELFDDLLEPDRRKFILRRIKETLACNLKIPGIKYKELSFSEKYERIPLLYRQREKRGATVVVIIGAQHNEFNGTFGMVDFLVNEKESLERWCERTGGGFCFVPIFNTRGFLHPVKENKSGYYVTHSNDDKVNLNRFWDFTFESLDITAEPPANIPREQITFKSFLWNDLLSPDEPEPVLFLDFHETSLVYRYINEMVERWNRDYILDHWIKDWILTTVFIYNNIPVPKKYNELDDEYEKQIKAGLFELKRGIEDLTFYFIEHTTNNEEFAININERVEEAFRETLIISHDRTLSPSYKVSGSIIQASKNVSWLNALEIEMRKSLYDLGTERERIQADHAYRDQVFHTMKLNQDITRRIISHAFEYTK